MPAGRPTKYEPQHGEAIIAYMRDGYSLTAAAGKLLVSRDTVYEWASTHPEFSDALNAARAAAASWWEDRLRDVAEKGEGNATAAIFGLKNRAADEWRERQEIDHKGLTVTITGADADL